MSTYAAELPGSMGRMVKIFATATVSAITLMLVAVETTSMPWTEIVQLGSAAGAIAVAVLFLREQKEMREGFLQFMTQERERQSSERKTYLQFMAAEFALHRKAIEEQKEGQET